MAAWNPQANALFLQAIEQPDPRAWLATHNLDEPLRAEVFALLDAHAAAGSFLGADQTATFATNPRTITLTQGTADHPPVDHTDTIIAGRYRLKEQIGEGGMGSVWLADQTEPVKRKVAVKLIKAGMDSKLVLVRFEAERQALALMDHPNIAKVLDGGVHEGRPYFVMELVKGTPITDFCDARRLTPRERLELFVQACQAIQHAHQKGVIHRDIKPSNVMIALYDDKPVVKVIDFGVAKATGGTLTEQTIDTGFGGVVGTPQYMSPEQATFNNVDIDTRSDVYALGVLLYELLTGTPPFSGDELKKRGLLEMLRVVREEEPPRPSTKLSTADALASLSANRGTEPKMLTGLLRNELDWIVMKALEKDRSRRYETANGFAADCLRYLSGDAVLAHPPSRAYRVRKFVRRNRGQVLAASLVLVALLGGIAGTTLGMFEAKRQERIAADRAEGERVAKLDADAKRLEAEAAAERERSAKEQAVRTLKYATRSNDLLGTIFEGLDPNAKHATVAEFRDAMKANLTKAAAELDPNAIGDPLALASMQETLAKSLLGLGETKAALKLFEKVVAARQDRLGAKHPDTLAARGNLASSLMKDGRAAESVKSLNDSVADCRSALGPDHPTTLKNMASLAEAMKGAGQVKEALPLMEESWQRMKATIGADHPDTIISQANLAIAFQEAGNWDRAIPLLEDAVARQKRVYDTDHPYALITLGNLAGCYRDAGQLDKAVPMLEDIRTAFRKRLGPDHPTTIVSMSNLAAGYKDAGRFDEALALMEDTLKVCLARLGPSHPSTLSCRTFLSDTYKHTGQQEKALVMDEETLKLYTATLGPDHPHTLVGMNNIATSYWSLNKLDKSVPLFEDLVKRREQKLGRKHPDTLGTLANLGINYKDAGRVVEAIPLLEEAFAASRSMPNLRWTTIPLFAAYADAGRRDDALKALPLAVAQYRTMSPKESPLLAGQIAQIAQSLLTLKAFDEAEPLLREALAIRQKKEPDDWRTFNTMSMLGGVLLHQKKYADAEPLLLKGYQGIKDRESKIPKIPQALMRVPESLERLIQLYEATNKPDEVTKWKAERAKKP